MCFLELNKSLLIDVIPFNVVCLSGHLHDLESIYHDPMWLGNDVALIAELTTKLWEGQLVNSHGSLSQ